VSHARKLKKVLYFTALIVGLLLCCKLIWFSVMVPAGNADADIAMRRACLVERIANEKFGPGDMPSIVASPYREELAIATLSMTTVALTNLAFKHPSERAANRDAVRVMLARMLSSEIRRYDVIWWGLGGDAVVLAARTMMRWDARFVAK